ncbi:MAG TPA: DNA polymerase III subunit delta' [Coxiellaceae bacterium]|nr:MAG: DNA polymerase III subunit delta' [Gammaproteobacteria bacterium RIFCSPHIGHO2_12_FULL_36_30]HLB57072.1 DNA polymerase III subunit delta' [Coxiellaceae bacterium]
MNQQSQFQLLQNAFAQNRLSHAYLLSGISGVGKTNFAKKFASILLCEKNHSCGTCRACKQLQSDSHPDFILIKPEEKSHSIKIDQIREMSDKVSRTAHAGGYQVVVISPADAMPIQAANALLKTLEEPFGKVIIFLIDDQKSILPATIISRCQKLFFSSEHVDLRLYDNALTLRDQLLMHLEKISDKKINSITFNPALSKINLDTIFQKLILICSDISRIQFNTNKKNIINYDAYEMLSKISSKISPEKLQKFIKKLFEKKLFISKGINLNQQLCLEDIFIEWENNYVY